MKLDKLPSITTKPKKRVGRGYGSTKGGHTASRGQKGQRSRNRLPLWFEGGQLPQIRRFPFIRGKGRFKSLKEGLIEINLNQLAVFPAKTIVDKKALFEKGLISKKEMEQNPVKILGMGEISVPLKIAVAISKAAAEKILAAGGEVQSEQAD